MSKHDTFVMWLFTEGYELCANGMFSKRTELNHGTEKYFFTLAELRKKFTGK